MLRIESGSLLSASTLYLRRTGRNGQPGLRRGGESGIRRRVPLHRRPLAVTAFLLRPADFPDGVLHIFLARRRRGAHAHFLAVVHLGVPRAVSNSVAVSLAIWSL